MIIDISECQAIEVPTTPPPQPTPSHPSRAIMATWIAFRSLATDIPTPARPLHADVDDYKWSLEALMVVEMKRRTRLWSKCFWVVISAALRLAEECKCAPPQIRTNYKYYTLKDNFKNTFNPHCPLLKKIRFPKFPDFSPTLKNLLGGSADKISDCILLSMTGSVFHFANHSFHQSSPLLDGNGRHQTSCGTSSSTLYRGEWSTSPERSLDSEERSRCNQKC